MFLRALLVSIAIAACSSAAEPQAKESGSISIGEMIPQIAAGGGWSTDIQLMHAHDADIPQPYTIAFYGSQGSPINMPVEGIGMTSVVAGVIPARGSVVLRLSGLFATVAGYAVLSTTEFNSVVATAVLTQTVPGRPDFQASVPSLDDFAYELQFPFRNDGAYTTTFAFVSGAAQSVTAIARNESGAEMCRTTWQAADGAHASYILSNLLSCTAGQRGVVEVLPQYWGSMIAFLFNDSGAFTTQLPFEICCRDL